MTNEDCWTLTVQFNPSTYSDGLGSDRGSFLTHLRRRWDHMSKEEFDACVTHRGSIVKVTSNLVDVLIEPVQWIMTYTVPKRLTVKRRLESSD